MNDIVAIARSAMVSDQQKLNTVSHNLANISTDGYKRQVFTNVLQQVAGNNALPTRTAALDFSQGVLKNTGNSRDIALNGQGFLVVDVGGEDQLTRRGALSVDEQGYLALTTGERIQGEGGSIQLSTQAFDILANGDIMQDGRLIDRLKRVAVSDTDKLMYLGSGFYRSNQPTPTAENVQVMQGYLEGSNVESLAEMMELMTTVRHYEAASQVLRSYDQVLDTAINNLADF